MKKLFLSLLLVASAGLSSSPVLALEIDTGEVEICSTTNGVKTCMMCQTINFQITSCSAPYTDSVGKPDV